MFDARTRGDGAVVELFRALELERRRREVELALLVGEVEQRNLYEPDGMRTVESWCRGSVRWTSSEARHAHLVARLLRDHADVLSVEAAVGLPVGHLREIARAAANPRCGDQIGIVMPALLQWGDTLDHAAFRTVVRHFEALADVDGTRGKHDDSHDNRRFSLVPGDVGGYVSGHLSSLQTAIVSQIFDRFCDAEFLADCELVTQQHGEIARGAAMPRTAAQRRADAFVAMALQAAAAPPGSTPPEPFVFVVDYQTMTETARRRCADNTPTTDQADATDDHDMSDDLADDPSDDLADDLSDGVADDLTGDVSDDVADEDADADAERRGTVRGDTFDGAATGASPPRSDLRNDPGRRRCESGDIPLDPDDVFTAAVLGQIRAVVVDRAGIIVKVGRRSRLFRGPLRDALLVTGGRCSCRGCTNRHRLEIDHVIDWQHLGNTDPDNADPRCRWHNNLKNKGFTAWRDPDGNWHHHRPDGTEITAI